MSFILAFVGAFTIVLAISCLKEEKNRRRKYSVERIHTSLISVTPGLELNLPIGTTEAYIGSLSDRVELYIPRKEGVTGRLSRIHARLWWDEKEGSFYIAPVPKKGDNEKSCPTVMVGAFEARYPQGLPVEPGNNITLGDRCKVTLVNTVRRGLRRNK